MKLKVKKYKKGGFRIYLPKELGLQNEYQNVSINGVPFKAKIVYNKRIINTSIYVQSRITVPNQIAKYLKLKNNQEVEFEIK